MGRYTIATTENAKRPFCIYDQEAKDYVRRSSGLIMSFKTRGDTQAALSVIGDTQAVCPDCGSTQMGAVNRAPHCFDCHGGA